MFKTRPWPSLAVVVFAGLLGSASAAQAEQWARKQEIKRPEFGQYLALWRITHDPRVEDQAGYHMQQVWSPNGRYLCYTHRSVVPAADSNQPRAGRSRPIVHVYDFHEDQDRELGQGIMQSFGPVWANQHNWLFWVQTTDADRGFAGARGSPVMWLNSDTGRVTKIGDGMDQLGGVDCRDDWVYGGIKDTSRQPPFRVARVRIAPRGGVQELPEATGFQFVPNPCYPFFLTRNEHRDQPFGPAYFCWNLEGRERRIAELTIESAHTAWRGNGEHIIFGDGLCRGRRHDQPAPSNVEILAAGGGGNISNCGRSGRFLVSDSSLFDLRSGDTWQYKHFLSPNLRPSPGSYPVFVGEARGSPDGTKVHFTVAYDMEKGPVTEVTENFRSAEGVLRVKSTAGFPAAGQIVFWCEVIDYQRKTPTTFEGLSRGLHGTQVSTMIPAGRPITDFRYHCQTDQEWKTVSAVELGMRLDVPDLSSPLARQRRNALYVTAVRRPDRPLLLLEGDEVRLIPGESHYETYGYHLLCDGKRVTQKPARPGKTGSLGKTGKYQAVAIEWSGLESEPSPALAVKKPAKIRVLAEPPEDFSWTRRRWLVKSSEVAPQRAASAPEALCEIVHHTDGLIAREWRQRGMLIRRHDLNAEGKAIRRLEYTEGKLTTRDYFSREGQPSSREVFAPDGSTTELIRFNPGNNAAPEADHWWYDRGAPVRRVSFGQQWTKQGEQWIQRNLR